MGHNYLVVPAVLVQGQVLYNNLGATFLPPDEINADWAEEWNGAPVVINDHPTRRGVAVSAHSPEVMDAYGVGFVFRARAVAGSVAQLKAEVWLDLSRVEQLEELAEIVQHLEEQEPVELSTGFFAATEEVSGVFNGEGYDKIMHPYGADHLAIFIDKVGACSVADGCGLGVQRAVAIDGGDAESENLNANIEGEAMPGNEEGEKLGLLSRLVEFLQKDLGKTPDVLSPTPNKEEGTGSEFRCLLRRLKVAELTNEEIGTAIGRSAECIGLAERGRLPEDPTVETLEKLRNLAKEKDVVTNIDKNLSDEARRRLLADVLQATYGGEKIWVWIEAMFSEQQQVVYAVESDAKLDKLFMVAFMLTEDGTVTLGEPVEVQKKVSYEPVTSVTNTKTVEKEEEGKMSTDPNKKVANANEAAAEKKAADEKAAAEKKVADEQVANEAAAAEKKAAEEKAAAANAEEEVVTVKAVDLKALMDKVENLEKVTAPAVDAQERERQVLVTELTANATVPFNQAELEGKPVEELRKLRAMSRGEDYALQGGPQASNAASADDGFAEPVAYFTKKEKGGDE